MATAITAFSRFVQPELLTCPETLVEDAILRTLIDFCTRTEMFSEIKSLSLVAGTATYTVAPTSASNYVARLRNVVVDEVALEKIDAATYVGMTERTDSDTPEYYFAPTRTQVTFAPIPAAADTAYLDIVLRPKRDATTVEDVLYEEWVDTIARGTKAELMLMAGTAWANPDLGAYYKQRYDSDVAAAATEVSMGNVGAAMHITVLEL